jgi:hypothetical protein
MSRVKFPKRHADGSFCAEVTLTVQTEEPEDLLCRIQAWLTRWVETNQVWEWKWDTGGAEELLYGREFNREPKAVSCTSRELKVQFEGQPSAEWWKDWLAFRIVPELKAAFAEVQDVSSVKDCE